MPNIIVCYKWVLDESDIRINSDLSLDMSRAKKKISEYDKNAIEIGTQIYEKDGGTYHAVSYGTADVDKSIQDALSRGPEEAIWVKDDNAGDADAYVIANCLAGAVKKVGAFDIVLCADSSADVSNQQVPARLAKKLGVPVVTNIIKMEVTADGVAVVRRMDDVLEELLVTGPAVYTVLPEIAQPRFPSIKQLMGAKKKPKTEVPVAELGLSEGEITPKSKTVGLKGYVATRKNIMFKDGTVEEIAKTVAEHLAKDGVL